MDKDPATPCSYYCPVKYTETFWLAVINGPFFATLYVTILTELFIFIAMWTVLPPTTSNSTHNVNTAAFSHILHHQLTTYYNATSNTVLILPTTQDLDIKEWLWLIMVALCSRCGHHIFALWFLSFIFLFSRLISAAADWMSTILPHMVWH